jgi:glycosyltransferase involved in cell wall biosynthesis
MTKIIDIILPNYNKKDYIEECLLSLLNQTYIDWRCIVIDGFSNDGSWEIIQEFALKDSRFELYQLPKCKRSIYEAWNFGLSKVINPFFCILTSDDLWQVEWLETAINSLIKHPTAIAAAAKTKLLDSNSQWGDTALFNVVGEEFFQTETCDSQLRSGILSAIAGYFIGPIYTSIHSLVIRSDYWLAKGERFAEDLGSTSDYEWYIKLGLYGDIIYHSDIASGWRIYEGQVTSHAEQEYTGKYIQEIHQRLRQQIADKLANNRDYFLKEAMQYDRFILRYHYSRPYLTNLFKKPLQEIPKLLYILLQMPIELLQDLWFKVKGKYFFTEASLSTARKVYRRIKI